MESKQTAVEWLINELTKKQLIRDVVYSNGFEVTDLYEQAKQMEKEQINKACYDGYYQEELYDVRNYYNDTYGI